MNPNLSEPALDQPKLRPHPGWSLKARRPFAGKGRHRRAKLDHDVCWRHNTPRRTPALVGSSRKRTSPFGFARGRASDLALHRLVERRSEQLKVHRPFAGGTFLSASLSTTSCPNTTRSRETTRSVPSCLPRLRPCT